VKKGTTTLLPSPFVLEQKKEKGDGSNATVTFFATLQQEKIKKATTALLPSCSSLCSNKEKEERDGNVTVITFFVAL
jgi:hypothetical protein